MAENLLEGFNYVRVDLYSFAGQLYFGEMTFTPGAGLMPFDPVEKESSGLSCSSQIDLSSDLVATHLKVKRESRGCPRPHPSHQSVIRPFPQSDGVGTGSQRIGADLHEEQPWALMPVLALLFGTVQRLLCFRRAARFSCGHRCAEPRRSGVRSDHVEIGCCQLRAVAERCNLYRSRGAASVRVIEKCAGPGFVDHVVVRIESLGPDNEGR